MSLSRKNHYVPQWYQKGFLLDDGKPFFYLDLAPDTKTLSDGRIITMNSRRRLSPAACFCTKDLYTTFFGGHVNDEIERFLFGQIDTSGSRAVRAFATDDMRQWHKNFENFFTYIDAQKLRTPKGLDWIRQHYPDLGQTELMIEMQALRALHCTLWTEGLREIVSAEESDIKFIVTDHPVTNYNHASPPEGVTCLYPNDPSIALKATQTLFPLDQNHCLILTNLEYARQPDAANPLENRTNPQPMRDSMVRTDSFIRERKLSSNEVQSINFILKSRARRYIASPVEEWLYPENAVSTDWASHKMILLPDEVHIPLAGGEMYARFDDGSKYYQDEFGRTVPENKYLKKDSNYKPGRNDHCGCGSGKKFKKCCEGKSEDERSAWDVYSIRERNLILCNGATKIFGFDDGKDWGDLRSDLSSDQIVQFYQLYDSLWPKSTEIFRLLPKPDDSLRGLYSGLIDPRAIALFPLGVCPYFDEILVEHPFVHPSSVKPEFSPIESPHQYKSQTLKHLLLLLTLEPFIQTGVINFFPDPCIFDQHLQKQMFDMASARRSDISMNEEEQDLHLRLATDDFARTLYGLPHDQQLRQVEQAMPEMSSEDREKLVEYMVAQQREDPLALMQNDLFVSGGQITTMSMSPNYELSLFIAQATGSILVTGSQTRWEEIEHAAKNDNRRWCDQVCNSISDFEYKFCTDPNESIRLRLESCSGSFRKAMRDFNSRLRSTQEGYLEQDVERLTSALRSGLSAISAQLRSGDGRILNGKMRFNAPSDGFVDSNVQRLLLKAGSTHHLANMSLAVFIELHELDEYAVSSGHLATK